MRNNKLAPRRDTGIEKMKKQIKKDSEVSFSYYLEKKLKDKDFAKGYEEEKVKLRIAMEVYRQRQKARISLTRLENLTGVPQTDIVKIESGKYLPSINVLDKIAIGLGKELNFSFN